MRTEGRDGARWPWLPSRPDRALRCPHGRSLRSWYKYLNTALDVDPPETPILVNSTPISITFSFEGLDSRILSYELQLHGVDNRTALDGGDTGVRLSDRVQFDAQSTSPAVRVAPAGRWIVTAGSLEVDFCCSLKLRELAGGGVTAWSEVSEGMSTEPSTTYRKSTYSCEEMLRRDPVDQARFTDRWCPHVMADRVVNRTKGVFGDGGLGLDSVNFMVSKKNSCVTLEIDPRFRTRGRGVHCEAVRLLG